MLEAYLRARQERAGAGDGARALLLMTHVVAGYPSFDESLRLVEAMVVAGVDLMELQIPFSEPVADGPVIMRANQEALRAGATVDGCLELAAQVTRRFDIPFLIMTYFNIVYRRGVRAFAGALERAGVRGVIVPDLVPELSSGEGGDEGGRPDDQAEDAKSQDDGAASDGRAYLAALAAASLDPIFIFAPTTPVERLRALGRRGGGFVYCVARKGVTGSATHFSGEMDDYLRRARAATTLPLAVGFGITSREDVDYLRGKADIAVVGSETLRVYEREGCAGVERFVRGLR